MNKPFLVSLVFALIACGPGKKPPVDAGPEEDAGTDAGVDAGPGTRMKGAEPPNGYQLALPAPVGNGPSVRMGVGLSMALDQFAHPMFAAIYTDPNNDGNRIDDQLVFSRWNGLDKTADGGTLGYQPTVTIATIGEIDVTEPNRPVSLARDPSTGTIGVAFVTELKTIRIATSADEGVTWSLETASLANPAMHKLAYPVLAMADNVTHLAYVETDVQGACAAADCGQVVYRKRTGKAAFADVISPANAGTELTQAMPIAMALDSAGNPGLAYFVGPAPVSALFWRPTAPAVTHKVGDSGGAPIVRTPSVALTFAGGTNGKVAYHLPSLVTDGGVAADGGTAVADAQLVYGAASDAAGTTWTAVGIPRNGILPTLEGTQWFQAIAVDSAGKIAIAANHQSGAVPQQCTGGPKVATSTDGTTFTTCRAEGGATATWGFAGTWINAGFHKTGKLTLAFTNENPSHPLKAGVIVYRQP